MSGKDHLAELTESFETLIPNAETRAAVQSEVADVLQRATKAGQKKESDLKARLEKRDAQLQKILLADKFEKRADPSRGLTPDALQALYGNRFKISETDDGSLSVVAVDDRGEEVWSRQNIGEPADFDEALNLFLAERKDAGDNHGENAGDGDNHEKDADAGYHDFASTRDAMVARIAETRKNFRPPEKRAASEAELQRLAAEYAATTDMVAKIALKRRAHELMRGAD